MYPSIWWKSLFKQSYFSCTLHFIETALAKGNFHHELGKIYHLLSLGMGLIFNVNLKGLMGHPLLTSSMFISGPKYASCSQSASSPALNVTVFILRLPWLARFFRLGVEEDLPRRLAINNTRWFTKSKWVTIHEYRSVMVWINCSVCCWFCYFKYLPHLFFMLYHQNLECLSVLIHSLLFKIHLSHLLKWHFTN